MKLTPYLVFNGRAEEALNFYANTLNGRVERLHRYDSIPDVADDFKQKILHSCLVFDHCKPISKSPLKNVMVNKSLYNKDQRLSPHIDKHW